MLPKRRPQKKYNRQEQQMEVRITFQPRIHPGKVFARIEVSAQELPQGIAADEKPDPQEIEVPTRMARPQEFDRQAEERCPDQGERRLHDYEVKIARLTDR